MPVKDRQLKEAIKTGMKTLILLEVRLLRLERSFTPHIIIEEMSQSIRNTKKEISRLSKALGQKERALLLKPDEPDVHYNMGLAMVERNKYDEAIKHFSAALDIKCGLVRLQIFCVYFEFSGKT